MIDFRNDTGTLFELAFGVKMPLFIPYPIQVRRTELPSFESSESVPPVNDVNFTGVQVKEEYTNKRVSQFGHPVYSPISFKAGTYKKFNAYGVLENVQMPNFSLPATTLVDISRSKIFSKTPQNAGEGEVVEMYGFEGWKIRMRILCLKDVAHPTHKTAEEQKLGILEWENLASGIDVFGKVFSEKDIFHIAIESINVSQLEGRPNAVPIEINAIGLTAPEFQTL